MKAWIKPASSFNQSIFIWFYFFRFLSSRKRIQKQMHTQLKYIEGRTIISFTECALNFVWQSLSGLILSDCSSSACVYVFFLYANLGGIDYVIVTFPLSFTSVWLRELSFQVENLWLEFNIRLCLSFFTFKADLFDFIKDFEVAQHFWRRIQQNKHKYWTHDERLA